jgi:hypothetical protein
MQQTNVQFDAVKCYDEIFDRLQKAIDFVYPGGDMKPNRAHPALMEIQGLISSGKIISKNLRNVPSATPNLSTTKD